MNLVFDFLFAYISSEVFQVIENVDIPQLSNEKSCFEKSHGQFYINIGEGAHFAPNRTAETACFYVFPKTTTNRKNLKEHT
jgi:hypothetical protein